MSNDKDTWINLVQEYFPGVTDEQADSFMWNSTCFPFGSREQITNNIKKAALESNGNIELAMAQADEITRNAMSQPVDSNWIQFTQEYFDNANPNRIIHYLWNYTPFQYEKWFTLKVQIKADSIESGRDIEKAIELNIIKHNQMLKNYDIE